MFFYVYFDETDVEAHSLPVAANGIKVSLYPGKFRKDNPRFFDQDAKIEWYVSDNEWDYGRFLYGSVDGKYFAVVGNFSTATKDITAWLPESGQWKDYEAFGCNSYNVTPDSESHNAITFKLKPGEFKLLVK